MSSSGSTTEYDGSIDGRGDEKALLGEEAGWEHQSLKTSKGTLSSWMILILSSTVTLLLGLAIGMYTGHDVIEPSTDRCVDHTTQATPIFRDLSINLHTERFNGSFMKENIYRLQGSPEVDQAWEALGVNYRALRLPEDSAKAAGLNQNHIRIKEKYGGGYPVNVEGLHHLHCLNLIRQSLYYNYNYYKAKGQGAFKNSDEIVQLHVSHCVDILRQQLMCNVDVGVFGQVWYMASSENRVAAFVDFNTEHKCRNYDEIRQWAEERQLPDPDDVPDDILEPPGPDTVIHAGVP